MNVSDTILLLERAAFGSLAWESVLIDDNSVYVVEDFGYALGARCGGEFELYRIGVIPACRRQGYGMVLLDKFHALCGELGGGCGSGTVFLEVDTANTAAVALYGKAGYIVTARRRGYYDGSDALIMRRDI